MTSKLCLLQLSLCKVRPLDGAPAAADGQMRLIGLYDPLNMSCQQEWVVIQEF